MAELVCPWDNIRELAAPSIDWCEANACSWIVEPANTYSNLAIVFVGLLIMYFARNYESKEMRLFGPAVVFLGAASFLYHASWTFALEIFDFFGMFLLVQLFIILGLLRIMKLSKKQEQLLFWGGSLVSVLGVVGLFVLGQPYHYLFVVNVIALLFVELYDGTHAKKKIDYHNFTIAIVLMFIATTFWIVDQTALCNSASILQFHALWQIFTAGFVWFYFQYYRQFFD